MRQRQRVRDRQRETERQRREEAKRKERVGISHQHRLTTRQTYYKERCRIETRRESPT